MSIARVAFLLAGAIGPFLWGIEKVEVGLAILAVTAAGASLDAVLARSAI